VLGTGLAFVDGSAFAEAMFSAVMTPPALTSYEPARSYVPICLFDDPTCLTIGKAAFRLFF